MGKIIYAIEVNRSGYGSLTLVDIKIGETMNIKGTLAQYKRSASFDIELHGQWVSHMANIRDCEKGIHLLAGKYALHRKGENFIFQIEKFQEFINHVNLLLPTRDKEQTIEQEETKQTIEQEETKQKRQKDNAVARKQIIFYFKGKKYQAYHWNEILLDVCELIYKDVEDFSKVKTIRGRKRVYVSNKIGDFTEVQNARKIPNTEYYADNNLSSGYILKIIKKMLEIYNYKDKDFIVTETPSENAAETKMKPQQIFKIT